MNRLIGAFLWLVLAGVSVAAEQRSGPAGIEIDPSSQATLQDGARTFMSYCMGCHSTQFQRYERVADDLGISHKQMEEKWITTGARLGDPMLSSLRPQDAQAWFGTVAPDLTLVARVRGSDWLYHYLRAFYEDPTRPWGTNNSVLPDVAMPNVLAQWQGRQVCQAGTVVQSADGVRHTAGCGQLRVLPGTGTLTVEEFEQKIANLVAFLDYSANPIKAKSRRIGLYVLLYLTVFLIFAYVLKREYWKDVRSN